MRGACAWCCVLLVGCSKLIDLDGLTGGARDEDASMPERDGGARDAGDDARGPTPDGGPDASTDSGAPCPVVADMTMARITTSRGSYCIDQTEVTIGQYKAFYDATQDTDLSGLFVTVGCTGVTDVKPVGFPPAPGTSRLPVSGITYCGAEAYCSHVGKSLCGDVAGGPLATTLINNPTRDAWMRACGGAEGRTYPYGNEYVESHCNSDGQNGQTAAPVGDFANCVTPDTGIFDLSGNVWEWVAACETDVSLSDACAVRGGANNAPMGELACNGPQQRQLRGAQSSNIGFRCCAP